MSMKLERGTLQGKTIIFNDYIAEFATQLRDGTEVLVLVGCVNGPDPSVGVTGYEIEISVVSPDYDICYDDDIMAAEFQALENSALGWILNGDHL